MALGSVAAENMALAACYGDNRSPLWPATLQVRLFDGDPRDGGAEVSGTDCPGYAPDSVANNSTNFPAPSGGQIDTPELGAWTSSGEWTVTPSHAALTKTDGTLLDVVALADPIEVYEAGVSVTVAFSLFHNEFED